MTPEAQRIAIAEACGFTRIANGRLNPDDLWGDTQSARERVPDYLNELNAMHEAEKVLTPEQCWKYTLALAVATKAEINSDSDWRDFHAISTATAAQRAEAFLRTIGKWTI